MSANFKIPQAQHRLSIQVNLDGLSFVIEDTQTNTCLHHYYYPYTLPGTDYNDWTKEVESVFLKDDFLQKRFSQCTVSIVTPKHTLVPNNLFQEAHAAAILKELFELDDLDEVNFKELPQIGATCIFAIPAPISAMILKYQRKAVFLAHVIPLFNFLASQKDFSRAMLHYTPSFIHVILMQGDKLLLCNAYAIDRFTSALYYVFFALKQWQMNPHSLNLYISGAYKPMHLKQLTQFFPSITVATAESVVFPTENLNLQFASHFFPTEITCE